jgi:hypothetical protein
MDDEAVGAPRLLGCTPGEQFARAWETYRESPGVREGFTFIQKAFATGDIEAATERLRERSVQRAKHRAAASRSRRRR